jgi:exonuclease III
MGNFRAAIDDLELREFQLLGYRFTWCNERENTTHTRIDRCFMLGEWELRYPQYQLSPASTAISDHCPLFLQKMQVKKIQRFSV